MSQEEWDRRAAAVGVQWLAPVRNNRERAPARCLVCGHEWTVAPDKIAQGRRCPECAIRRQAERSALPQKVWNERAAAQGLEWLEPASGRSMEPVPARCLRCGREFNITPNQVQQGHGCRACASRRAGAAKRTPQEVWDRRADAQGIKWLEPVALALATARARCLTCGHEWNAMPARVQQGSGCPRCRAGGKPRIPHEAWDEYAADLGLEWSEPVRGTRHPARIACRTCGYEWTARPDSIQRGQRCRACAGNPPVSEEEWTRRAAASHIEWRAPVVGAKGKVPAKCTACGLEWDADPHGVAKGSGCPSCAGVMPQPQEVWDERASAVGLTWLEPVRGSRSKTLARCLACGHEWRTRPDGVAEGKACPACSQHGINPALPGRVYLVTLHGEWMKVGVMNQHTTRLEQHERRGWTTVATWDTATGTDAIAIESATLQWWRDERGARFAGREDVPAGDGHSETIRLGAVTTADTATFIRRVLG